MPRQAAFFVVALFVCLPSSLAADQTRSTEPARSVEQHLPDGERLLGVAGLPAASPHEVGLSAERLERIQGVFQHEIDDGALAGAVALVARHGKVAYFETLGELDREASIPMRSDAIFRIASMSKPITSVAVMSLMEEGRFLLDDPVSRFLPGFADMQVAVVDDPLDPDSELTLVPAERQVTIRHLLSHTSGLTYGLFNRGPVGKLYREANLWGPDVTLSEFAAKVGELPLVHQPGTAWEYGISTDILGRVVEVASGMPFDEFLAERIFRPLGMNDTGFFVPDDKADRLAAHYAVQRDGTLVPAPAHLDFRQPPALPSGGAGVVSTVGDYARFAQMLLNGGELDGVRILSRKSVELMSADHTAGLTERGILGDSGFGLGLAVRGPLGDSGNLGSPGAVSWSGIYNTFFWVDPAEDLFAVFMTQVSPFGYRQWRNRIRVLTYQAVAD